MNSLYSLPHLWKHFCFLPFYVFFSLTLSLLVSRSLYLFVTLRCTSRHGKCYSLRCALPASFSLLSHSISLTATLSFSHSPLSQCLFLSLSPHGSKEYQSRYMVVISKLYFGIVNQQVSPFDSLTFFFCLLFSHSLSLFCYTQMYKPREVLIIKVYFAIVTTKWLTPSSLPVS